MDSNSMMTITVEVEVILHIATRIMNYAWKPGYKMVKQTSKYSEIAVGPSDFNRN